MDSKLYQGNVPLNANENHLRGTFLIPHPGLPYGFACVDMITAKAAVAATADGKPFMGRGLADCDVCQPKSL